MGILDQLSAEAMGESLCALWFCSDWHLCEVSTLSMFQIFFECVKNLIN